MTELYHQYGQELFAYLCWLTKDPHRAEDLLQETFLRAMTGILRFEGRSSVKTWLFVIARRSYVDGLRRQKINIQSLDEMPEPAAAFDLEMEILDRELRGTVGSALDTLDERARKVVVMRSQGFTFAEAAADLGISQGSARVVHHRAMKKLKEFLGKEGAV